MDQCNEITSTSGIGGEGLEGMVQSKQIAMDVGIKPLLDGKEKLGKELDHLVSKKDEIVTVIDKSTPEKDLTVCTTTTPTARRQMSVLLDLKRKTFQYCAVPTCCKRAEKLTLASSDVLAYYGFKNKLTEVKVCDMCFEKAKDHQKKSMQAIRSIEGIFAMKHEPQIAELIELDDDDDDDSTVTPVSRKRPDDLIKVDFERNEVGGLVQNVLKKFNIHQQIQKCKETVSFEAIKLGKEFEELSKTMKTVDDMLYKSYITYRKAMNRTPRPMITQEVEINADGSTRRRNVAGENVFINKRSLANIEALINRSEQAREKDDVVPSLPERKPGPASKTDYYEHLDEQAARIPFHRPVIRPAALQKKTKPLLPTPLQIPKLMPNIGDIVYAYHLSLLNHWLQAEVLEILENKDPVEYVIRYEQTVNGKPTGGDDNVEGVVRMLRQVTLKELAYNIPCPFLLPVGTRVIAKFKEEANFVSDIDGYYYAGIIADPPKLSNNKRYLVFFDDGYAQYVDSEDVLLVCESSKEVWDDIHPDSHDFIKEYIQRYPEWPLARLSIGSLVSVEWNGLWSSARIMDIDANLVKVRFQNDGHEEWIYRGSSRLRPVYNNFLKEEQRKREERSRIPRHDADEYKDQVNNVPPIEYKYEDPTAPTSKAVVKRNARKSTGRFQYSELFPEGTLGTINMLDIDVGIEFQGTMTRVVIPLEAPSPKPYCRHVCNPDCVIGYVRTKEMIKKSPLAIPLFLGWQRDLVKSPRKSVFYRTPCGLRIKNYAELNRFIEATDCNLSVDHFSFDIQIDCLNEFTPSRALVNLKDISYGKESVPVQCVNSVDYDSLPYMEYTPVRVPGEGVNINADDEGFRVCCDCTDNCEDKSKCACWQLTQDGLAFTKLNNPNFPLQGYENRRLKHHVVSGIYECSSSCKCKETCSNRVVQNGVMWPLQIFKTTKKGWGIRALYDMPEGSFICVYTGEVLNDQSANEEGIENGDEYLAEMDYIECVERVKAGYESDVTDIEAESSDSSVGSKTKRIRRECLGEDDSDSEPEKDCHSDDSSFKTKAKVVEVGKVRKCAMRRTGGGTNRNRMIDSNEGANSDEEMITARTPSHFSAKPNPNRRVKEYRSVRPFFGDEKHQVFIMDAKKKGNIGRYLNHSCKPNVFVQNVFVDTHDLRFPMVAFFTSQFVRAGTELTWDYHYEIGSVPGKVLYCFCMTPHCRGRLL